jgi:hypothetical protein
VAGAAATTTGPAAAVVASGVPPDFLNNNVPTKTDQLFPQGLGPCANDAVCEMIMDGLAPIVPPGTLTLFDIPGSCQSKSRDWLRTGKDVLVFDAERIRQRYAMTVFFCEQDGGEWLENDMWISDMHECDWYNRIGIDSCNRVEQMEIMRINDNGLQGTLPLELSILSTLFEFTVSNNLISGTFPAEYAALTDLDTFVIAFNQFEGPLPGFFFRFPDMVYLDVAYNKFTGTLPQDVPARMPDLQVLFMENNKIGGTVPDNLGELNLRRVHMDDNLLEGTIPASMGNPPRLQQLYMHNNNLEGQIPDNLKNLEVLKEATFHYNNLDGDVTSDVCELMYQKQLTTLSVDCPAVGCECCNCGEPGF